MGLIADTSKAFREAPQSIFNFYLFSVTWIFALAGVAKGFDEGWIPWSCGTAKRVLTVDREYRLHRGASTF